jgi:hypothetical protein
MAPEPLPLPKEEPAAKEKMIEPVPILAMIEEVRELIEEVSIAGPDAEPSKPPPSHRRARASPRSIPRRKIMFFP